MGQSEDFSQETTAMRRKTIAKPKGEVIGAKVTLVNDDTHRNESTVEKKKRYSHEHYDDVPTWKQDNPAIFTGYRSGGSWRRHLSSLFLLHNQTVNIWTHFIGFLLMLYICVTHFLSEDYLEAHDMMDVAIFMVFFVCAMLMFFFSAVFHLLCDYTYDVKRMLNRLDYAGISLMIVGSFYPMTYYCFYCYPVYICIYLTAITVLGALAIYFSLLEKFDKPEYRPTRALIFSLLGLMGVFPTIHFAIQEELERERRGEGFSMEYALSVILHLVAMGGLYLIGAAIYAARIPERYYPGRFDNFLASHQIFHICVVLAALVHYLGTVKNFEQRAISMGKECVKQT